MTHPPRFLHSILAQPTDDSPRLRYANWLEGCGNPLGEFIRLQCLLARNHVGQPHISNERRAQELLARFESTWCHCLAGQVKWWSFRRGFVEEIALSDRQFVRHAARLFGHAPVCDIHLQWTGASLDALPSLPSPGHTVFLDVSSQRLGNVQVGRLAESPLLKQVHGLNLGTSSLNDIGLEALFDSPHLDNLRELYLNDNPITDEGIRRFVMSSLAERLECLDVRFTPIGSEGIAILKRVLGKKVLHGNSFC